jgi:hypothetical protein
VKFYLNNFNKNRPYLNSLLRETVGTLACFLQDSVCLSKTPELWNLTKPFLSNGDFASSPVAAYAREIVYNYHIQNTYDVDDWDQILFDYDNIADSSESRKLLEALTYTRLPWLLARFKILLALFFLNLVITKIKQLFVITIYIELSLIQII